MHIFLLKRILGAIPVLLGVSFLVFALMTLIPGNVEDILLDEVTGTAEQKALLREQLGLNDPFHIRYLKFLGGALQGDLGRSFSTNRAVLPEILEQLPSTIELALAAMLIAVPIGVVLGLISAIYQNSWIDHLCMMLALTGVSTPVFAMGLFLILIFAVGLNWLPALGQGSPNSIILPAIALGLLPAATIARLVRSSMLEVLHQEYMVTARAKGVPEWAVLIRHGLKNALIPTITIIGLQVGALLSGAVLAETVFARQGLGRLTVTAILRKDFPLVQGCVLVAAFFYVLVNLLVDISYAWFDPRVRNE